MRGHGWTETIPFELETVAEGARFELALPLRAEARLPATGRHGNGSKMAAPVAAREAAGSGLARSRVA